MHIVHRDIKPHNIVFDSNYQVKFIDFNFSEVSPSFEVDNMLGTHGFMAPEVLTLTKFDGTKADIYSAGIVMYSMVFSSIPFRVPSLANQ